jgi:hypothetical protein
MNPSKNRVNSGRVRHFCSHEATTDHKSSEETNDLRVGFQGALKK